MRRLRVFFALSVSAIVLSVGGSVEAQVTVDTAVVHIGVDSTGSTGISNIVGYLQGDPRFATVASIDVDASGVPTAGQLAAYDSVLIVTDNRAGGLTGGGLGTQLGNVLDDYVTGGGRVVFSTFSGDNGIGVDGQILALAPHTPGAGNASAGVMDIPTGFGVHPVFNGVTSFLSSYAGTISVSASGILLASYASGTLGVLTVADDSVMFVNGFPGMQADYSNGTDFGRLFANALAPLVSAGAIQPIPSLGRVGIAVFAALLALAGVALILRLRAA